MAFKAINRTGADSLATAIKAKPMNFFPKKAQAYFADAMLPTTDDRHRNAIELKESDRGNLRLQFNFEDCNNDEDYSKRIATVLKFGSAKDFSKDIDRVRYMFEHSDNQEAKDAFAKWNHPIEYVDFNGNALPEESAISKNFMYSPDDNGRLVSPNDEIKAYLIKNNESVTKEEHTIDYEIVKMYDNDGNTIGETWTIARTPNAKLADERAYLEESISELTQAFTMLIGTKYYIETSDKTGYQNVSSIKKAR